MVTRQQESHQLFCEVVRCSAVSEASTNDGHSCATIVRSQDRSPGEFQPPTPWVVETSRAPILFVVTRDVDEPQVTDPSKVGIGSTDPLAITGGEL